jgi:hypothetical protein
MEVEKESGGRGEEGRGSKCTTLSVLFLTSDDDGAVDCASSLQGEPERLKMASGAPSRMEQDCFDGTGVSHVFCRAVEAGGARLPGNAGDPGASSRRFLRT